MRIGWKQFLKKKMRSASSYHSVGIAYTADQVLLCALKKKDNKLVWELDASFSHQSWQKSLPEYVAKHKLAGTDCYFALSSHWYRIHQIDKPNVQDQDLFSAIQWPLKEVSGSEKDIVYDFADLPVQVAGQNKLIAVAVAKEEIEKLTNIIHSADLELKSISVEEFATNQLVQNTEEPIITLVQEHGEVVVLNIVKNNQLYFSRRLKGFENIGGFSEAELDMGITDSLCVQIQRSMDFFESQLRQAPIRKILLKLDSPHITHLCNKIAEAMGVNCSEFLPNIACAEELNFKLASYSCLGAAFTKKDDAIKQSDVKPSSSKKEAVDEVTN